MGEDNFWKTIKIWSQKTHVVNKRLTGVAVTHSWTFPSSHSSWLDIIEGNSTIFKGLDVEKIIKAVELLEWKASTIPWTDEVVIDPLSCYVSLRKCIPKQPRRYEPLYELEFIDAKLKCAVYIPVHNPTGSSTDHLCPICPYAIKCEESGSIDLKVYKEDANGFWLLNKVLPKLRKWYAEMDDESLVSSSMTSESLRLVSLEEYNKLYQELKEKYVPNIAKIWPECTDPQKFIHEDVAIAAYLMLIWRQERTDLNLPADYRQSYLDIGCGNGLLVYLLSSEGHPGKGIDIRARKIWSLYPPEIKLEVFTLTPTEETEFLEYDWLLGNHSDELTPWIPVMSLQSSVRRISMNLPPVRYWVLPCCPFSFFSKFQRTSGESRYAEYLRFVQDVGRTCGYQAEEDRMRIPSTRRTCFVGTIRPDNVNWKDLVRAKTELIASSGRRGESSETATEFRPRPAVELVRNCTRVERSIQDRLVDLAAKCLLAAGTDSASSEGGWNAGGTIDLPDLVDQIRRDFSDFDRLKSECGGLQTLLKNHSSIFIVRGKTVRFRSPEELSVDYWRTSESKRRKKGGKPTGQHDKVRDCWFFAHHPDGCPLNADSCRYVHNSPSVLTDTINQL